MRYKEEKRLVISHIKRYKVLVSLNLFLLFVASLFEGLGLSMIIPILQSVEGTAPSNFFTSYAKRLSSISGIDFSFLNLIIIFGIVMLIGYGIVSLQQYITRVLSSSVAFELRNKGFQNLMELPLNYYYKEKIGDIIASLYTSSNNSGAVVELALQAFTGLIFCFIYVIVSTLISLPLTIIACSIAAISYFLVMPRFSIGFAQGKKEKKITYNISSFLQDTLGGIKTLKSFNNEKMHLKAFKDLAFAYKRIAIKIQKNRIIKFIK